MSLIRKKEIVKFNLALSLHAANDEKRNHIMPINESNSLEALAEALKYFYNDLGVKIWGKYGFYDAFSIEKNWFPSQYLALDQGPAIVMIENYRSGLLWKLFMSCPEIQNGLKKLDFKSPLIKE